MEKNDPLVQKIAEEASMEPEYVEMMNYLESDTEYNDIDPHCELKQMKEFMDRMSVVTLDAGTRLIVKDETEILIPKCLRKQMEDILHFSHTAAQSMITQCKNKIFWPGMRKTLQVSGEDIFANFMPGQRLQVDYAEKGNSNYLGPQPKKSPFTFQFSIQIFKFRIF